MKKLKFKISPKKITFWFYFLVIIASLFVFGCVSLFLYENFYQTITQSKEILILQEKVAIEAINMKKYDIVMEKIKQKTSLRKIEKFSDPFD
ncbi:hypothetical protein KAU19_05345 [Candidatus Parcubacteria bacterium]|nr:hypothetical protein [Candidatus Parcubacteria bacterium]